MLNTQFATLLGRVEPTQPVRLILEVDSEQAVGPALQSLAGVPAAKPISQAFNYITVEAPLAALPQLEAISVRVHADAPRAILTAPVLQDAIFGRLSISPFLLPFTPTEVALRLAGNGPRSLVATAVGVAGTFGISTIRVPALPEPEVIIVPTGMTRQLMLPPDDTLLKNTKVAVLDTGAAPHPQLDFRTLQANLRSVTGEPPLDGLGHGQWCTTCAFGGSASTRFGTVQGVATASAGNLMHVKCLNNIGFGSTSGILKAMETAVNWGARVISMSLGGPLQGSVVEDPECVIIQRLKDEVIFVVAAGNDGAPWTIGSPGASPFAITVGAYSTVYKGLAIFSSRGPSAEFYQTNPAAWQRDLARFGQAIVKPDCIAPGGGPVESGQQSDMIYSGVWGWMNGQYDMDPILPYEAMRGTSMATPHAAGLIALAVEQGLVSTAVDVQTKLAALGPKNANTGYGFLTYPVLDTIA